MSVFIARIVKHLSHAQIVPKSALEQHAILWYESQASSKDIQANVGDVLPVYHDRALLYVDDPKERLEQRTLASPGSPDDADLCHRRMSDQCTSVYLELGIPSL